MLESESEFLDEKNKKINQTLKNSSGPTNHVQYNRVSIYLLPYFKKNHSNLP
jgi:hypothetical protein